MPPAALWRWLKTPQKRCRLSPMVCNGKPVMWWLSRIRNFRAIELSGSPWLTKVSRSLRYRCRNTTRKRNYWRPLLKSRDCCRSVQCNTPRGCGWTLNAWARRVGSTMCCSALMPFRPWAHSPFRLFKTCATSPWPMATNGCWALKAWASFMSGQK